MPAATPRRDVLQLVGRRTSSRGAPTLWDRKPMGRAPAYQAPREVDDWWWVY